MSNLRKLKEMSARRVFKDQDVISDYGDSDSRPTSPVKQVGAVSLKLEVALRLGSQSEANIFRLYCLR